MRRYPQIGDDILDTRAVDDMIEELEDELEEDPSLEAEQEQLKDLLSFREDLSGYCDWVHGETLILDTYRVQYTEQFAADIGAVSEDSQWPNNHIDWHTAMEDLFQDYTSSEIGRFEYYVRVS